MRIVFFGTPEMAVPSLEALASSHSVLAVVCQPDRPKGRSQEPVPPPAKLRAQEMGIQIKQPEKLNDGEFEAWLRELNPDLCCLVAYGRILKQPVLDVPKHGFLNLHPSLLPRHRGPSPIQSAILEGDSETGVTIMRLDAGMDTGDILLQEIIPIDPDDTTESLTATLSDLGARLLLEGIALIESGEAAFTPQEDEQATVTKRFRKTDGSIRWSATAQEIDNLVRAALPWPVAHCVLHGKTVRIYRTEPLDEEASEEPGTVIRVEKDSVVVATGDRALAVLVIQPAGKRVMEIEDFLRGHPIKEGDRFEDL